MLQNGQMELSDLGISYGKTCREHSAQTKEKISDESSKKSARSKTKEPLFLDLRVVNGKQADVSWEMGIQSLGEFSTQSFGECPNDVVVSHLSQILEEEPPLKYYLSEKACMGILRRAENRNVEIKPMLKEVLLWQSGLTATTKPTGDIAKTLIGTHTDSDGLPLVIPFVIDRAAFNQGVKAQYKPKIANEDCAPTLTSKGASAVCYGVPLNFRPENMIPQKEEGATLCNGTAPGTHNGVICYNGVRRHTPLECERLQGFEDGWTDIGDYIDSKGKLRHTTDTARYKALGNSIAIPPWKWVIKRLCAFGYSRDATMASLFDGIGGFPYIWEQINGKGSCLWASEIEDFCIAVTKYHFKE